MPIVGKVRHYHASGEAVNPEAIADLVVKYAREMALDSKHQRLAFAFADVEAIVRQAVYLAIREVHITAPGVVIEDLREHGGAVVSDLRSVQDKANG